MDNLAIVDKISLNNGLLIPCIRILRGIQIAARQQNATFVIEMSFRYQSGGREVSTELLKVPIKATKGVEDPTQDPMFCRVRAPDIELRDAPDAGTSFACDATITITQVSGVVTPCSPIDTQVLEPR